MHIVCYWRQWWWWCWCRWCYWCSLCLWMFDFITFRDTKERVSAFISLSQMRFSIFRIDVSSMISYSNQIDVVLVGPKRFFRDYYYSFLVLIHQTFIFGFTCTFFNHSCSLFFSLFLSIFVIKQYSFFFKISNGFGKFVLHFFHVFLNGTMNFHLQ